MLRCAVGILRVAAWHPDGGHFMGDGLRPGAAITLLREHQERAHVALLGNGRR